MAEASPPRVRQFTAVRGGTVDDVAPRDASRRRYPTAQERAAARERKQQRALARTDEEHFAYGTRLAEWHLARSAVTRADLVRRLTRKLVPEHVATAVVDRLVNLGVVDDTEWAQSRVRVRHGGAGDSRSLVAADLRRHGVTGDDVDAALAGIDADADRDRATALARTRARSMQRLDPAVRRRRLVGLLTRRGYPLGLAFEVVDAVDGSPDDTDSGGGQDGDRESP